MYCFQKVKLICKTNYYFQNHVDKYGYVAHVERVMNFQRNRRKRRQAVKKESDETIVNNFRWTLKFYQKFMGLSVTGRRQFMTKLLNDKY